MSCSHLPTCPLLGSLAQSDAVRIWKLMYCESDVRSRDCERFKRSEAGQKVPPNMLPNGKLLEV